MEPTSFNVGDGKYGDWDFGHQFASMEPTSFNVGDSHRILDAQFVRVASMEPTSFNVGDCSGNRWNSPAPKSFNGADVFQRRRRERVWEAGHDRRRFNGADVFQRRRRCNDLRHPIRLGTASMEPTSFNVGDNATHQQPTPPPPRFNGADVFQRRRLRCARCARFRSTLASMEPTSFNVGDVVDWKR